MTACLLENVAQDIFWKLICCIYYYSTLSKDGHKINQSQGAENPNVLGVESQSSKVLHSRGGCKMLVSAN